MDVKSDAWSEKKGIRDIERHVTEELLGKFYEPCRFKQDTAGRHTLIAWYLQLMKAQDYVEGGYPPSESLRRPCRFGQESHDYMGSFGMNQFEVDIFAMFVIFNVIPTIRGCYPPIVYIPSKTLTLMAGDLPEYSYRVSDDVGVRLFENDMVVLWDSMIRVLGSDIKLGLGTVGLSGTMAGHGIAYTIDYERKIFDIFDPNGIIHPRSPYRRLRNTLASALSRYGLEPFAGVIPPGATTPKVDSSDLDVDDYKDTPGLVNRYPLRHLGSCGMWSVSYLWFRALNGPDALFNMFNRLGSKDFAVSAPAMTTAGYLGRRLNKCTNDVFARCVEHMYEYVHEDRWLRDYAPRSRAEFFAPPVGAEEAMSSDDEEEHFGDSDDNITNDDLRAMTDADFSAYETRIKAKRAAQAAVHDRAVAESRKEEQKHTDFLTKVYPGVRGLYRDPFAGFKARDGTLSLRAKRLRQPLTNLLRVIFVCIAPRTVTEDIMNSCRPPDTADLTDIMRDIHTPWEGITRNDESDEESQESPLKKRRVGTEHGMDDESWF